MIQDIEIETEKKKFITPEHEILHELHEVLPKFALKESLRIEFLGGQVPVLRWEGSALLNELSPRARELLTGEIERHYTRKLVSDPVDIEPEACGSGEGSECCGGQW